MKQSIFMIFFLFGSLLNFNEVKGQLCPDPLNIQSSRADSPASPVSTVTGGVVTCGFTTTTPNCAVLISSGAGICIPLASTTPSTSAPFYIYRAASQATAASIDAFTGLNKITTCWNPSVNNQVTASPVLSATNQILACQTTKAGVGSPIFQTVGTGTTASTAVSLNTAGASYCFTTNCNVGLWINSNGKIQMNLVLIFAAILSAILFY